MAPTSCGASMTTHSSSSPTTQRLLSTSNVSPSSENVPDVTAWSTRSAPAIRRQPSEGGDRAGPPPRVHLLERRLDVADADLLAHERVEVQPSLPVEVDQHRE